MEKKIYEKLLKDYAELVVKMGSNLKKGEELHISSPIISCDFARAIQLAAYNAGARRVTISYVDDLFDKNRYQHESLEVLTDIAPYRVAQRDYIVEQKAAHIAIIADDPDLLSNVDAKKVAEVNKSTRIAFKRFYDAVMGNSLRWTLAAYPNTEWAKKVFPNETAENAVEKLWQLIIKTMRLDTENPISAWQKHNETVKRNAERLNSENLVKLVYKNSLGTDFSVGLPENYLFLGAAEVSKDGIPFIANMPTEEVFSAPAKYTAQGTLVSSMPLSHNGKIIDGFSLTFKDGKVIDYSAKCGLDVLKSILDTDEGAKYLGEVALVPYDSPIQNLKTLFYNTLFDENASCHFALGRAYPICVKNGDDMTEAQLEKAGLNTSLKHVDFMVGTSDLSIIGERKDGSKLTIFKNGNFAL